MVARPCLLEHEVWLVAAPKQRAHGDGEGEGTLQHATDVLLQSAIRTAGQEQLHARCQQVRQEDFHGRHPLLTCDGLTVGYIYFVETVQ
jgi:hypothetical protein